MSRPKRALTTRHKPVLHGPLALPAAFEAGDLPDKLVRRVRHSFHAPYLAALMQRPAEESGGVRATERELQGALREARSMRRQMNMPGCHVPGGTTRWLDETIERLRAALDRGDLEGFTVAMCTNCGAKPRWFDDVCKGCAEQLGVRPHGKVA